MILCTEPFLYPLAVPWLHSQWKPGLWIAASSINTSSICAHYPATRLTATLSHHCAATVVRSLLIRSAVRRGSYNMNDHSTQRSKLVLVSNVIKLQLDSWPLPLWATSLCLVWACSGWHKWTSSVAEANWWGFLGCSREMMDHWLC